jgi:hypothetical protein
MADRSPKPADQRALAALARDAALARIGRARVTMLIAAVVLTALFAALASALLPGKSLGASGKTRTAGASTPRHAVKTPLRRTSAVAPGMPAPAGPAALGLQGPNQAPTAVAPAPTAPSPGPSAPAAPAQPAPAPAAPSGGGAVVSGGS